MIDVFHREGFMDDPLYDSDADRSHHLAVVQRLADRSHVPVEQVLPLYEDKLRALGAEARVKTYLTALTSKQVLAELLHRDR